jgi:serine/threonine-protein kinase HipA
MRTLMASQIPFLDSSRARRSRQDFSIRLLAAERGQFRLTPMYDVMSAYPVIGDGPSQWVDHEIKLAMSRLGKRKLSGAQNRTAALEQHGQEGWLW